MDDILIVPDIHGRDFWKPALKFTGKIVFLGDYTDPYPSEHFSYEDSYNCMLKIINLKINNPDRVTLLLGNHELHYITPLYRSSRFNMDYYDKFHELLTGSSKKYFQVAQQTGNYLFTHAGILKGWYDIHYPAFSFLGNEIAEQLNNYFIHDMDAFAEISSLRGGENKYGSPLWADLMEHLTENGSFNNRVIQIFGHTKTQNHEPTIRNNIRMLDNQKLYLLKNNLLIKYS